MQPQAVQRAVDIIVDQFYKHVQARGGNRYDTSSLMVLLTDD